MSKKVSYIITDHKIVVNYDGQTHQVPRTDPLADRLLAALRANKLDEIPNLVSTAKRIEKFSRGNFVVRDGEILVNGQVVPSQLGKKIIKFSEEKLPYQPLIKFAENLQKNPSFRAVNELFQFLEKNDHPITENGCFIAYKKVRADFKDVHSGTFDNSPGNEVEMPRNQVNEDATQTCSDGLHVANFDYASHFYAGGVMLEVEVNPADVVAVPVDYNQAKMRTCKYKVLGVVDKEHSSEESLRVTNDSGSNRYEFEEEEEDEEELYCENCDGTTDPGYRLCLSCEEAEDEDAEEDDAEYPWEKEV